MIQETETVTVEISAGDNASLVTETDRTRKGSILTTIRDQSTDASLATVSQKESATTKVHFLQAKGGFFCILTTPELTYLALPGSQIQLQDTLLNMPGELPPPRSNPDNATESNIQVQQVTDQAMILGAGIASRFVPVSGDLTGYAKPSVPLVGEDSVIVTLARHLHRHGIRRILVNTYYKPEILKEQLLEIEDLEFVFIDEEKPSGTAGGLLKALDSGLVDRNQPILIMQGDAVTDADLSALLNTHEQQSPLVTLGVKYVTDEEVSQMAIVVTDRSGEDGESGKVQFFKEKPTLEEAGSNRLASIGFYVLAPQVFDTFSRLGKQHWEASGEYDYAFHFFPGLLAEQSGSIYARMVPQPFYWSDIGRPDQYITTVREIHAGKLRIELPEDMERYFEDGVIFWEDAKQKAVSVGASLKGNLVVFNTRD